MSQVTPGVLFRYIPEKQQLQRIGDRVKGQSWLRGVVSDADGRMYTSTYPDAKLLRYDPQTGETRDYGSVVKDAAYGYTSALVGDEVWVGTGAVPHLMAIQRETGAIREIAVPGEFIKNAQYISKLNRQGECVFMQFSPAGTVTTAMYNLRTKEWGRRQPEWPTRPTRTTREPSTFSIAVSSIVTIWKPERPKKLAWKRRPPAAG